jgi:hypothetical protein
MTPYEEGKKAYHAGKKRRDNPYHMSTSAHEAWDEGWSDASLDD